MKRPLSLMDAATPGNRAGRRTIFASLAAIGGVLAASTCCWPILPFVTAAGVAGSSAFLVAARPVPAGCVAVVDRL